jgi:hypothetical protein
MSSAGDKGVEVNPNRSGNQADQVRVTYPDPFLKEARVVTVTPTEDGMGVVLGFVDAEDQIITTVLTPALTRAIAAALALSDLPGTEVTVP